MSQFSGRQHKGAMKARRAEKRTEAEVRNGLSDAKFCKACWRKHDTKCECPVSA
ncbi:MAG: hypothetical protein ACXVGA_06790 [Mycobacteriaceae bacterium]